MLRRSSGLVGSLLLATLATLAVVACGADDGGNGMADAGVDAQIGRAHV